MDPDMEETVKVLAEKLQTTMRKLKDSADQFEPVTLEPNESMLLFRIMTEGAGIQFSG